LTPFSLTDAEAGMSELEGLKTGQEIESSEIDREISAVRWAIFYMDSEVHGLAFG
jgi:hypothetical protein